MSKTTELKVDLLFKSGSKWETTLLWENTDGLPTIEAIKQLGLAGLPTAKGTVISWNPAEIDLIELEVPEPGGLFVTGDNMPPNLKKAHCDACSAAVLVEEADGTYYGNCSRCGSERMTLDE